MTVKAEVFQTGGRKMSEEKLYVVKNDEGKYWDTGMPPWWDDEAGTAFKIIDRALKWAKKYDGHVVTLIEEPKKVALTKEQAKIIEEAKMHRFPAAHISNNADDSKHEEELLMEAYVNGYTVAKEKKYVVYKVLGGNQDKENHMEFAQACRSFYHPETMFWVLTKWIINDQGAKLTEKEISDFGLQDCEKEEVTDDDE